MSDLFTDDDVAAGVEAVNARSGNATTQAFVETVLAAVAPQIAARAYHRAADDLEMFIRTPPGVIMSDYTKALAFARERLRAHADKLEARDSEAIPEHD
jgi:predicted nucleic acid-binding protein